MRAIVRGLPPDPNSDRFVLVGGFTIEAFTTYFLDPLRTRGLVDAVLTNVDRDGCSDDENEACLTNWVPHRATCWSVLRHVLANPDRYGAWELDIALRSAPAYALDGEKRDCEDAARLLTEYLRADTPAGLRIERLCPDAGALLAVSRGDVNGAEQLRAWECARFVRSVPALAAVGLAQLAPDTPGLAEILGAALGFEWVASKQQFADSNQSGPGAAAEAIRTLGPHGRTALPPLRAAILHYPRSLRYEGDLLAVIHAYRRLLKDDADVAEIRTCLENLAAAGQVSAEIFRTLALLAKTYQEYAAVVSRLIRTGFWGKLLHWGRADESFWLKELSELNLWWSESEILLPAYAAALEWKATACEFQDDAPGVDYGERSAAEVREFLDRVSNGPGESSAGDAFVAALRGRPPDDLAWLVYADWLEERGEPQAELLRVRHALAQPDGALNPAERAELSSRQDKWFAAHGRGWATLFDLIGEPPPTP